MAVGGGHEGWRAEGLGQEPRVGVDEEERGCEVQEGGSRAVEGEGRGQEGVEGQGRRSGRRAARDEALASLTGLLAS